MKQDIQTSTDIETLVDTFYHKIRNDATTGYIFNDIIGADWSHHLPVMYSFWESILFSRPGYQGNVIKKHIDADKKIPLEKEHFERWLELWNATIDELFSGTTATAAKTRAALMANLISIKVTMARDSKFIQ